MRMLLVGDPAPWHALLAQPQRADARVPLPMQDNWTLAHYVLAFGHNRDQLLPLTFQAWPQHACAWASKRSPCGEPLLYALLRAGRGVYARVLDLSGATLTSAQQALLSTDSRRATGAYLLDRMRECPTHPVATRVLCALLDLGAGADLDAAMVAYIERRPDAQRIRASLVNVLPTPLDERQRVETYRSCKALIRTAVGHALGAVTPLPPPLATLVLGMLFWLDAFVGLGKAAKHADGHRLYCNAPEDGLLNTLAGSCACSSTDPGRCLWRGVLSPGFPLNLTVGARRA